MPEPTDAAVLVPLFRRDGAGLQLALIRRVNAGIHAGEIGLPGGKREPGDASLRATALRETAEEIGVAPADVEILEELPVVRTLTTRFAIHPFLARIRPPDAWVPQAEEVDAVIEIALRDLLRPATRTRERIDYPGVAEPFAVDCFRVGDVRIWGATYRILDPLVARLDDGSPP